MKIGYKFTLALLVVLVVSSAFIALNKDRTTLDRANAASQSTSVTSEVDNVSIVLQVQDKVFTAELYDNLAAKRLASKLPFSVQMTDVNGNEKKYNMPDRISDSAMERPTMIYNGDIMCWQGDVLVLFYKTFDNHYGGYTRIGRVNNPEGLAAALGTGTVEVKWMAQNK